MTLSSLTVRCKGLDGLGGVSIDQTAGPPAAGMSEGRFCEVLSQALRSVSLMITAGGWAPNKPSLMRAPPRSFATGRAGDSALKKKKKDSPLASLR